SSHLSVRPRYLRSFPTRRSSDLFSFANLRRYPTSALMTRFTNDIRQVQSTVFMGMRILFKAPLVAAGGVIMAFIVNTRLALIFRSEEHTSELQSRFDLVCRLLLV